MKSILAFGDSFSDNGFSNDCGFNRLSNGKVWVEHLAEMLALPLEDRAWCGAKSGKGNASGPEDWSGLAWQVDSYIPNTATPDALCTLLIGINDVYDGTGEPGEVVGNILGALEKLFTKGVRKILLGNMPDISHAPAYVSPEYAPLKAGVSETAAAVNSLLARDVFGPEGFAARHPEMVIIALDAHALFEKLATDGVFRQVDTPWNGTYAFPHADGYLWWDEWHPTTEAHRQLALAARQALGGD